MKYYMVYVDICIGDILNNLTSAPFDAGVCAVATTLEEVGSRGAVVAANR